MADETFAYAELSERAKARARDQWREAGNPEEWWESVYEDAQRVGQVLGVQIYGKSNRTVGGYAVESADINFELGNGGYVIFTGTLWVNSLPHVVEKVQKDYLADKKLAQLATDGQAIYDELTALFVSRRLADYDWSANIEHLPACDDRIGITTSKYSISVLHKYGTPEELQKLIDKYIDDFAAWILHQLEAEDAHLCSDEYVAEQLIDLIYDEDGNEL